MKKAKTQGQELTDLVSGSFLNLSKVNPSGSLEARKLSSGAIQFYWRYALDGKRFREPIGFYDSLATPRSVEPTDKGYSIAAATAAAEVLARKHASNLPSGGLPGLVQAAEEEKKRLEQEAKTAAAQAEANEKYTLAALIADYGKYMVSLGRDTKGDARSTLKVHVVQAWPTLAAAPAKALTDDQFADMMRKVFEAGKGRTANKLRSYLRSAYQVAKAARTKPTIPLYFKGYEIRHNPVAETLPDESQNKTAKNPLSLEEMQIYWRAIKADTTIKGAVLRVHLLAGSQRIAQLMRLKTVDIGEDSIKLYDRKGRPGKAARLHIVPMAKVAMESLIACKPTGEYAFSTDGGKTHIDEITMSKWAKEFAANLPITDFATKRLRSGVETVLSGKAKINKETRGRLQSHGIGGVQNASYDAYDYMDEKLDAVEKLYKLLEAKPTKTVEPFPTAKQA